MKRLLLLMISILLVFSLVACQDNESESSEKSSYDERYEKLPEGFIKSEKQDIFGYTQTIIEGTTYESYATASLINAYITLGYDVKWTSETEATIDKGMVECFLNTEQRSLKYKNEECIMRAPGLESFVVEPIENDLVLDTTTLKYVLSWTGYPCDISYSKENGTIIIEQEYYDDSVMPFNLNDYKEQIKLHPSAQRLDPVSNSYSLRNSAYDFWNRGFTPSLNQDTYKVYFDLTNSVWLIHGTLPEGASAEVPYMIVKPDGTILASWRTN